jgi:mRNA interferase RelE/StbE
MVRALVYSERFKRNFKKMPAESRRAAKARLSTLVEDPFHPSLRSKRIQGTGNIWESSITESIRMTWCWGERSSTVELRNIGEHNRTLNKP